MLKESPISLNFNAPLNGKYKAVEWLEPGGGMSQVLKAEQISVNSRPVILKFLTWNSSKDRAARQKRYGQEMKAMARLPHQRIVSLYDFEWYNDIPFLVMDYMPGGSLEQHLPELRHNREKAFKILKNLCNTVEYIHQQGIVHCDLKPSNILFDASNELKISDFGIAKLPDVEYNPDFTGTPGYMAPEQKQENSDIDHRADIYALGVIAWELFSRQFPPDLEHPPHGQFSFGLLQALRKALAVNRDERYTSATEFLRALSPFISEEPCGRLIFQVPLSYRNRIRQMFEDYTGVFGGRERIWKELELWLDEPEQPFAFLQSPAGQGKTALLIHWSLDVQSLGQWHVIFYPLSIRYETAAITPTVRCLAEALAPIFDGDLPALNLSPELLKPQITEWLRRDLPEGKQVLIIVDGLDEAEGWSMASLFPKTLGRGFKLLASARTLAGEHQLCWLTRLKWDLSKTCFWDRLPALKQADLAYIIRNSNLLEFHNLDTDSAFLNQLERVSEGDPLTTRYIIEALRDGDMTPQTLAQYSPGLQALLDTWLQQLDEQIQHQELSESQKQAAKDVLGLCAIALGPFTADDLAELLHDRFKDAFQIRKAVRIISRFIIGNGQAESGYVFSHSRFREFFAENLLQRQRQKYQQAFLDYGQRVFEALPQQACPGYLRQFWMTHLVNAQKWEQLQINLLKRHEHTGKYLWAEIRYAAEGSYAGFLSDLDKLWQHAEKTNNIPVQLECALIHSTIRTLSGNISPELLVCLVTVGTSEGKWSIAAALEYIKNMPDEQKAQALELVVKHVDELHYPELFKIACTITQGSKFRPKYEFNFRPRSGIRENDKTEKESDGLFSMSLRANMLITLASYFPSSLCLRALKEAILAQSYQIEMYQPSSLAKLVSRLSEFSKDVREEIIDDAFEVAQNLKNEAYQTSAKIKLIPYLSPSQQAKTIQQLVSFAQSLDDETEANLKVQTLTDLAPYLPEDLREELMWKALTTIPMIMETPLMGSEHLQSLAFVEIAPYLPASSLRTAFEIASKFKYPTNWLEAAGSLFACIPAPDRIDELRKFFAWLTTHSDENIYEQALENVLPKIADDLVNEDLVVGVIEILGNIQSFSTKISILYQILPILPEIAKKKIIEQEWAKTLENFTLSEQERNEMFVELICHLPLELIKEYYPQIIPILKNTTLQDWDRSEAIIHIGSLLNFQQDFLDEALSIVQDFTNEYAIRRVLTTIAQKFSQNKTLIEKIWKIGENSKSPEARATVLINLCSFLPEQLKAAVLQDAFKTIGEIKDSEKQEQLLIQLMQCYHFDKNLSERILKMNKIIHDRFAQVLIAVELCSSLQEQQTFAINALYLAQMIENSQEQVEAFTRLIPHLPTNSQHSIFQQALKMVSHIPEKNHDIDEIKTPRLTALNDLLRCLPDTSLPDTLLSDALDVVQRFSNEEQQADFLVNLIQYIPEQGLEDVFKYAPNFDLKRNRIKVLIALSQRFLNVHRERILKEALTIAIESQDEQCYLAIYPHLSKSKQQRLLPEIILAAERLFTQAKAMKMPLQVRLREGVSLLPEPIIRQALQTTKEILEERAGGMTNTIWIAPFIIRLAELGSYQDALDEIKELYEERKLVDLWSRIIPLFPQEYTAQVLELMRRRIKIGKANRYLDNLTHLSSSLAILWVHLPESSKPEVLQEILQTVKDSESLCTDTFKILMPHLVGSTYLDSTALQNIWQTTLQQLSLLPRSDFLQSLCVFIPLALHLSEENGTEKIYGVIEKVIQAWP